MKTSKTWRKKLSALVTATLCVWGSRYACALPENPHDEQNIASITNSGNTMDIIGQGEALNSFIKWNDFSVANGQTVNFSQMKSILNLVDGNKVSEIYGSINAQNINFFLLNPNGVIFGAGSQVDVGSLTVSARTISDDAITNFISNGTLPTVTDDDVTGGIVFLGNVTANKIIAEGNNISIYNSCVGAVESTGLLNVGESSELKVTTYGHVDMQTGQSLGTNFTAKDFNGNTTGIVRNDFTKVSTESDFATVTPTGHYMIVNDLDLTTGITVTASTFLGVINGLGHKVNLPANSGFFAAGSTVRGDGINTAELSNLHFVTPSSGAALGKSIIADKVASYNGKLLFSNIRVSGGDVTFTNQGAGLFGDIESTGTTISFVNVNNSVNISSSQPYLGSLYGQFKENTGNNTNNINILNSHNSGNITSTYNGGGIQADWRDLAELKKST